VKLQVSKPEKRRLTDSAYCTAGATGKVHLYSSSTAREAVLPGLVIFHYF